MSNSTPYISRKQAQDFIDKFGQALESPESNALLFQVYGFGGVGKTTLTRKLKEAYNSKADFVEVSFGRTPSIETPLKLMEKLYELLPKPTNILQKNVSEIRPSDFAVRKSDAFKSLYEQYQQTVYKLKTQPVEGNTVEKKQQTTVKDWLELGTLTTLAIVTENPALAFEGLVKAAGFLSDAPQAIKSIKEDMQDLLKRHPATQKDADIQALMLEPIPKLTHALAQSLIERSNQLRRSIVLVLDTYEKAPSDIDTWLWQYLLEDTPLKSYPIRIVVAGRRSLLEKENWRKLQQDKNSIYQQQLNEFNEKQTEEYLKNIGITKSGEIHKIYKATKGLPYYLNWIIKEKEEGRKIDFSRGNKAIVDLLLQGLNEKQKQIVQFAACCRSFDKPLIQYLMQRQGIDFETEGSDNLNCFEWLKQCDFVELVQGKYRLDDVARDVFRLSFRLENKTQFCETHELLANYFEQQANKEVPLDRPEIEKYENADWRLHIAEFLYHSLFAKRDEGQRKFIYHLFASRYLKQIEVVMIPFAAIIAEAAVEDYRLLPDATDKFIRSTTLGFLFSWDMLDKSPDEYQINDENGSKLSKENIEAALRPCLNQVELLEDGLGKYAGLLYKTLRSQPNQQLNLLQKASEQAELIAIDSYPEFSSSLFFNLGNILDDLKFYEQALINLDKALLIRNDYVQAWYQQGISLSNLERYKEAITKFDQALAIDNNYYLAHFFKSLTLASLDLYKEALEICEQGLIINNNYSRLWHLRGIILRSLECYEEAIKSYDQAILLEKNYVFAWHSRGITLADLRLFEEALNSYDNALKIKPDHPGVLNAKSLVLSFLNRYNEALETLDKVLKIEPQKSLYWANKGIILSRAGFYQEGLKNCEKAIQLNPDDESGYYATACCYVLQGVIDLALKNLQKAININSHRCRLEAKTNPDFDSIRNDSQFQALMQQ
ncbi:MAG TPA: tetratricopeptide repeat protein [Nostocaceae cyanobacterium]|nr:tetratricopeptide repeat protein [Nostocaceae cyanobacterium]